MLETALGKPSPITYVAFCHRITSGSITHWSTSNLVRQLTLFTPTVQREWNFWGPSTWSMKHDMDWGEGWEGQGETGSSQTQMSLLVGNVWHVQCHIWLHCHVWTWQVKRPYKQMWKSWNADARSAVSGKTIIYYSILPVTSLKTCSLVTGKGLNTVS